MRLYELNGPSRGRSLLVDELAVGIELHKPVGTDHVGVPRAEPIKIDLGPPTKWAIRMSGRPAHKRSVWSPRAWYQHDPATPSTGGAARCRSRSWCHPGVNVLEHLPSRRQAGADADRFGSIAGDGTRVVQCLPAGF